MKRELFAGIAAVLMLAGVQGAMAQPAATDFSKPVYPFCQNAAKGWCGMMDAQGNVVVAPPYQLGTLLQKYGPAMNAQPQPAAFSNLQILSVDGRQGVMNAAGTMVVPAVFNQVMRWGDAMLVRFGNKLYPVTLDGQYIGFTSADVDRETTHVRFVDYLAGRDLAKWQAVNQNPFYAPDDSYVRGFSVPTSTLKKN